MANVVIKNRVAAHNIDSYNRTAVCTVDIDNGCVFKLDAYSTNDGEEMVWKAVQAAEADGNLWMATTPEVVITRVLTDLELKGVVSDPRAFVNLKGKTIDATRLNVGDIIEMTGEGISGIATETNIYLTPSTADFKLKASATAGTGLCLKKVGKSNLHIGNASLVKTPVPTYKFVVESN